MGKLLKIPRSRETAGEGRQRHPGETVRANPPRAAWSPGLLPRRGSAPGW